MKKKTRQVLAIIAIILIVGMYVAAFVLAFMKSPQAQALFRAAIACTIIVPVILYVFLLAARAVRPAKSPLIDTIVFDVGDVLVDFPWVSFCEQIGIPGEKAKQIFFGDRRFAKLWHDLDLGIRPFEEVRDEMIRTFPGLESEIRLFLDRVNECLTPYSYTMDWLTELHRRGYQIYILSNWSEFLYKACEERGDFAFLAMTDGAVWSYREHMAKPNPDFFRLLINRYHIDPKRSVFIDDMKKNTDAAASLHFNTITFKDYGDTREKLKTLGVRY